MWQRNDNHKLFLFPTQACGKLPKQNTNLSLSYGKCGWRLTTKILVCIKKSQVPQGKCIKKGQILVGGNVIVGDELALGKNVLVAYLTWEYYNFEDAILISEHLVHEVNLQPHIFHKRERGLCFVCHFPHARVGKRKSLWLSFNCYTVILSCLAQLLINLGTTWGNHHPMSPHNSPSNSTNLLVLKGIRTLHLSRKGSQKPIQQSHHGQW